jgi:5-dehydro-2-deoxygluconokinase
LSTTESAVARTETGGGAGVSGPEIITIGRIGVDLYPEQIGVHLADVQTFVKGLGGTATNVAVGAARLGRRSAVITKVGDDGFGSFCRRALEGFGVDNRWVGTDPTLRTPVTFCEIFPPDDFPLLFYRQPSAPDLNVAKEELDLEALAQAELVWTTGTGLSCEPSRSAVLTALETAAFAVHDLDDRPMLWPEGERHEDWSAEAVRRADVVVGNQTEAAVAVGPGTPLEQAQRLLALGPRTAIVKQGPKGVLGATAGGEVVEVPPVPVEVVCGLGAGDAFGGALCHGLLSGWPLERTLRFANAAGAIVASRLLCADAMPTSEEVEEAMAWIST